MEVKNIKIGLVLFMFFFLSSFVFADDVIDGHGIIPDSVGSFTAREGIAIETNKDLNIKYIIKSASSTASDCYLFNDTAAVSNINSGTPLATGSFIGNNCSLNYNVSAGEDFALVVDNGGSSYTRHYNNCGGACGFVITGTNVNFTGGRQGTTLYTDFVWDVLEVGTEEISDFFIITAKNNITSDPILNFTANVSGNFYESNNTGQIITGITKSGATLENITLSSNGYYNETYHNYNVSMDLVAVLDPLLYSSVFYGVNKLNDSSVNIFSINNSVYGVYNTTNGTVNADLPLGNILFNISNQEGYYNFTDLGFEVNESDNEFYIEFFDSNLTVYAWDLVNDQNIDNFTITLANSTYSFSETQSTTEGYIFFNLSQGTYNLTIDPDGYETQSVTINVSPLNNTYNFSLYTTNSINISIYDELSKNLITQNVDLEFISDTASYNYSTSTGNIYVDLLAPETYQIRLISDGYDTRYYTFILENRTNNVLNIYLLNTTISSDVTVTVIDESAQDLEGALVKVLKYDIETNTYILQQSLTTNVDGEVVFQVETNTEFYYFIVEFPIGNQLKVTTPSLIYDTITSIIIQVQTGESPGTGWQKVNEIVSNITFYNDTNEFTFRYNDLEGTASGGCLDLYESYSTGLVLVNSSCAIGASNTITVAYSLVQGKLYVAKGYVTLGTSDYLVNELQTINPLDNIFNFTSLFFIGILILAFAMVGIKTGPAAVIMLPVIGLLAARIMGLLNPILTTGLLMSMLILSIILAFVLKRRGE